MDSAAVANAWESDCGFVAPFHSPIAGVFFVLEIILGEITGNALGVVVLPGVISAVFTQAVSGPEPAFYIPAAFAMVGMAALLAGAVHSPLTAILLLFEMTHDYRIDIQTVIRYYRHASKTF